MPSLVPYIVYTAYTLVSDCGFKKYGNRESWKNNSPREGFEKYLNAMMRHGAKYAEGEYMDRDSGHPHIFHCIWNAIAAAWHLSRHKYE